MPTNPQGSDSVVVNPDPPTCTLNDEVVEVSRILAWREWARVAMQLDLLLAGTPVRNLVIYSVLLKNTDDGQAILLMARAIAGKKKIVTFHRAGTAVEAISEFYRRMTDDKVVWRDDKPLSSGTDNGAGEGTGLPVLEL